MKLLNIKKNIVLLLVSVLSFTIIFTFTSCDEEDDTLKDRDWQLSWEDEFEGPAGQSPSSSNWTFDLGNGCPDLCGWGNAELQSYTADPENVSLDGNGNLVITALDQGGFTSAKIHTKGKFEQAYGRFEARIKMPYGPGLWPAFWMLGADIDQNPWPQCGEIDIVELYGHKPSIIHGSLHGPGYFKDSPITKTFGFENDRFDADFHVFRIDWGEDFINYYVDDVIYQQIKPEDAPGEWVFDHPFYCILNVTVGGNSAGLPFPTTETIFPQTMLVDYVRVYTEVK